MSQAQLDPADEGDRGRSGAALDRERRDPGRLMTGVAMIVVGLLALIAQNTDKDLFQPLLLVALGAVFLVWGVAAREYHVSSSRDRKLNLLVPGGILLGIGVGAIVIQLYHLQGGVAGGAMLLSMALGWAMITVCAKVFAGRRWLWPLIPAAILAFIGALLLAGMDGQDLRFLGNIWPLVLIGLGLRLLFSRSRP